jgi:hypothetical protein
MEGLAVARLGPSICGSDPPSEPPVNYVWPHAKRVRTAILREVPGKMQEEF